MNTLIVYDSQYGNTKHIAEAIAGALQSYGQVQVIHAEPDRKLELQNSDLLILGCPTQGWKPTPALKSLLDHIAAESLRGLAVACFDTRFRMPRWMTGSAAGVMAKELHKLGITPIVPPESFFIKATEGPLDQGEEERAVTWAKILFEKLEAAHPVAR